MNLPELAKRAEALRLYGLLAKWPQLCQSPWVEELLTLEENERRERGLRRRLKDARIGPFKQMADFDYSWPRAMDRQQIDELFEFDWLAQKSNVIFVGPNGVGKTMIARNLSYQAALRGYTVRMCTAGELLGELREQGSTHSLNLRLKRYTSPQLLAIDEIGYLSYDSRAADLLFEVINRRYENASTIITTNKPFNLWPEVFPNAACVVTLIDRLVHHAEIVTLDADSFRLKDAREQQETSSVRRLKQKRLSAV